MARGWGNDNAGEKLLAVSPGFGSLTWLVVFRRRTFTAQLGTRRLTAQLGAAEQHATNNQSGSHWPRCLLRFAPFLPVPVVCISLPPVRHFLVHDQPHESLSSSYFILLIVFLTFKVFANFKLRFHFIYLFSFSFIFFLLIITRS